MFRHSEIKRKDETRMKKAFASALCLLLMIFTVISCAKPAEGPTGTLPADTKPEETEGRITSDLPAMTFDGRTFDIAHWYVNGWTIHGTDLYAEEPTGDPIGDSVYARNARISEDYDVTFAYEELDHADFISKIRSAVTTGEDPFDLLCIRMADTTNIMMEGNLLEYGNLTYVDLDKPYWDQSMKDCFSFGGSTFMMTSDTTINDKNGTSGVAFNKVLARDLRLPDLYEEVREGSWTQEELLRLISGYDADKNGDGELKIEDDILGMVGQTDVVMSFFMGGGGHFTSRDEADFPVLDFNTEENIDVLSLVFDLVDDEHFAATSNVDDVILGGHSIFSWIRIENVVRMRGMDGDDFGVLPTPKYDESQENYLSLLSVHGSTAQAALFTETDPEFVSFMMEALAAGSHYEVQEAYYDVTLKTKSARDDESQEMLDIIFSHRVLDIADLCNFGTFTGYVMQMPFGSGSRNIASAYAQYESKMQADIDDFCEKLDKMI